MEKRAVVYMDKNEVVRVAGDKINLSLRGDERFDFMTYALEDSDVEKILKGKKIFIDAKHPAINDFMSGGSL